MNARLTVSVKEAEGNVFYYIDVGYEYHGHPSFRLWLSSRLVKRDENGSSFIEFPIKAHIFKTEKGSLVMKPSENSIIYNIFMQGGYRGDSRFEIVSPLPVKHMHGAEYANEPETAPVLIYPYYEFESPRGSLGVNSGALVEVSPPAPLKVKWSRSGRLYGSLSRLVQIYYPDGKIEELEGTESIEDLKGALE